MVQKLSPQQIQLMKLLQIPTATLDQRIKEELEANPALDEGENNEEEQLENRDEDGPENTAEETEYEEKDVEFELDDYLNEYIEDDPSSYKLNMSHYSLEDEDKSIVILRDVVIVAGSFMYHYLVSRLEGQPTFISKLNTGLEFAFLIFVMSRAGFGWPDDITITVVGAAVLVTVVVSGYDYVSNWIRSARAKA